MLCQLCKSDTKVLGTIKTDNGVFRLRECKKCSNKIYTRETVDTNVQQIFNKIKDSRSNRNK